MYIYISPILGELSEDFYNEFILHRSQNFAEFTTGMKSVGYRELRSGILVIETQFKDVKVSGTDIYNYLINFGFDDNYAVSITKLFSTNNRLIKNLIDQGFKTEDVVYGMNLKARLDTLGIKSATTTKHYAFEDVFIVHKLLEVEIEEPKEIQINIIPDELPFTINNEENFIELINKIKSFEDKELDKNVEDIKREIEIEYEVQIYYKETGEISGMSIKPVTTRVYSTTITIINRKEWTWMTIESIYKNMIVPKVVKRYSKTFGLQSPPGENTGSYDWRLNINSILFTSEYLV